MEKTFLGLLGLCWLVVPGLASADAAVPALTEPRVVEILTADEDGEARKTPVWIVAVEGLAYVRTNDSVWLANIRRGSPVKVRHEQQTWPVSAAVVSEAAVTAEVEEAFVTKYGFFQRVMSTFRTTEPSVLRLEAEEPAAE